ncbi:MAG: phosphate transport system permease protein, partial [Halioglobus sp.]
MQTTTVFLVLIALCVASFFVGRRRSRSVAEPIGGATALHSLPKYYGYMAAAWAAIPALLVLVILIG